MSSAFLTFLRPVKLIGCSVGVRERPWTFNFPLPLSGGGEGGCPTQAPTNLCFISKNNVPIYLQPFLSLNDTQVFITHPSAQCWTLASAARFNGRKLGMQNRPVVKGHAAPSASIQTMENLPVFSFYFLPKHSTNNEALLWLTVSAVSSTSPWMRPGWGHISKLFGTQQNYLKKKRCFSDKISLKSLEITGAEEVIGYRRGNGIGCKIWIIIVIAHCTYLTATKPFNFNFNFIVPWGKYCLAARWKTEQTQIERLPIR